MSALDTVERSSGSSLPASSGMQLDSILNALASITLPPPPGPQVVAPPAAASSGTAAVPPRAPGVQASATVSTYSASSGGASPRSHTNITQVTAHNFYNNTFDDPAWYKSHSQTVHADMGAQPRTQSVKVQHTNPDEAIVDAARKFYNNSEGVGPDGRWAPQSHEHQTFGQLDKNLRPYSSPPSGKPSGLEERLNQQAQIVRQLQQQKQEQAQVSVTPTDVLSVSPANANAKSTSESQEYYLDKGTMAKLAANDGKNVYTRGNAHHRPQKSTRYFKDFLLSSNSPLQFSSDYVPPPPPLLPATASVTSVNAPPGNASSGSGGGQPTAGMSSKIDEEVRRSSRRSATHILNLALKESMQDEKEKRNDRFSRRALRQKAAAGLAETAYVPQMANNQSYLRHQLNKKDDSNSGYVNFDEFRSSLKQADILLTYEEYLDVFNKFTRSASSEQAPVPVTVQNSQSFSPPASGGRLAFQAPHPENDKALRERFKGVVGNMSTGKVLNIEEFLNSVQSKAQTLAADGAAAGAVAAGASSGNSGGNEAISRIADQALNKEKRRIFFKVLHSMNKHADPSKVFRHLDGERVGHLRPDTLRAGLNHLGASLSDCEFNTLLRGVGYGDPQGQSFIDLHRFDKVLHEELDTQTASASAAAGAGGGAGEGGSNPNTADASASSEQLQNQHQHQHRKTKRSITVPGHGQFLQHHPKEYDNDESGITSKITQVDAPSPRGFGSKESFVGIQEQLAQLASSASTDAKSASRLKNMQNLLECLQPQRSEFSRMVDSQHTKDSSMKWSKLKWALQSDPQRVLRAFVPSSAANSEDFNKNKAAAAASKTEKRLQKDQVLVQDLQQLSLRDLEMQLHNSGFVLGAEDRNILRFHLQSMVGQGQGQGQAGSSGTITLQTFCDTVGIPLREHRSNHSGSSSSDRGKGSGGSASAPPPTHIVSARGTEVADGGIFACSNPSTSTNAQIVAAANLASSSRDAEAFAAELGGGGSSSGGGKSESASTAKATTSTTNFGTQVSMFNDDNADSWMKGMHKRRVQTPGAPTQSLTEPWKYLALLEHGSDAIWPTVPAAKATDGAASGNFHFSKRLFTAPQTNPLYGDYDLSAAQAQAHAASGSRKHFSARSSSAPPSSRKLHSQPGWANSDQFKAAQAEFASSGGADESRGRSASRGGQSGGGSSSSSSDAEKVRRWASGPLLDKYSSGAAPGATAAASRAAPPSTQHEHVNVFSGAPVDSSRMLRHTLRKAHPNSRPASTPFALDI